MYKYQTNIYFLYTELEKIINTTYLSVVTVTFGIVWQLDKWPAINKTFIF